MKTASASLLIFQHFLPLYPPLCCGDQSHKQVGMPKPWFSQHLQTRCSQRWAPAWPRLPAQLAYLQRHCSSRPSTRLNFETAKQISIFLGPPCLQALPAAPHLPLQRLESLSLGMVVPCEFLWSQAGVVTAAWGGGNFISFLRRGSESIYLLFFCRFIGLAEPYLWREGLGSSLIPLFLKPERWWWWQQWHGQTWGLWVLGDTHIMHKK